jgi:hypothetical protein
MSDETSPETGAEATAEASEDRTQVTEAATSEAVNTDDERVVRNDERERTSCGGATPWSAWPMCAR